jgi:hypothetical protein
MTSSIIYSREQVYIKSYSIPYLMPIIPRAGMLQFSSLSFREILQSPELIHLTSCKKLQNSSLLTSIPEREMSPPSLVYHNLCRQNYISCSIHSLKEVLQLPFIFHLLKTPFFKVTTKIK